MALRSLHPIRKLDKECFYGLPNTSKAGYQRDKIMEIFQEDEKNDKTVKLEENLE